MEGLSPAGRGIQREKFAIAKEGISRGSNEVKGPLELRALLGGLAWGIWTAYEHVYIDFFIRCVKVCGTHFVLFFWRRDLMKRMGNGGFLYLGMVLIGSMFKIFEFKLKIKKLWSIFHSYMINYHK